MSNQKKIKEISLTEGLVKTIEAMKTQALGGEPQDRSNIFRTEESNWIVDTVVPFDTGVWETGISKDSGSKWTIVEQYKNQDEAKKGHEKWVQLMKENSSRKLEDIHVWG